jgi:WD40 repeat protein
MFAFRWPDQVQSVAVASMAFHPRLSLLALGTADKLVMVFSSNFKLKFWYLWRVLNLFFSIFFLKLQLQVWDVEKGFCTHRLTGHEDIVVSVRFLDSADSSDEQATAQSLSETPKKKKKKGKSDSTANGEGQASSTTPTRMLLVSTSEDNTARVWDLMTKRFVVVAISDVLKKHY